MGAQVECQLAQVRMHAKHVNEVVHVRFESPEDLMGFCARAEDGGAVEICWWQGRKYIEECQMSPRNRN